MAKTIAVCNQKGGVGKTTTAVNICASLAISGMRTLLIDLDSQGNATIFSGVDRANLQRTVYDSLIDQVPLSEIVVSSAVERLDVAPATIDLAGVDVRLSQLPEKESILKKLCDAVRDRYDAILLDCPPSLGLITVNALVAADAVLIPLQCEYLSLEGLTSLTQAIDLIRRSLNPSLEIGGIALTMTDFRANLAREVADEVRKFFPGRVFDTTIPRNVRLAESPSFGKPIFSYDPNSVGAISYHLLAKEVMNKMLGRTAQQPAATPQPASQASQPAGG